MIATFGHERRNRKCIRVLCDLIMHGLPTNQKARFSIITIFYFCLFQLWRAIRLVVDTGLHYKGFSRQNALQYFQEYMWETSDVLQQEVTRYQSSPGHAIAYMVGQQHIIKLREHAQKELGKDFNLKDFHYHILKHGSSPLSYLTESIDEYIRCTKNHKDVGRNMY